MSYSEALEQQVAMLRYIDSPSAMRLWELHAQKAGYSARSLVEVYRSHLQDAEPFFWAPAMCSLLQSIAPEMPDWSLDPTYLVAPVGFAWFSVPLALELWDGDVSHLTALSWHRELGVVSVVIYVSNDGVRRAGYPVDLLTWREGSPLSDVVASVPPEMRVRQPERFNQKLRYFAAMCVLLNQRILVAAQHRAERHASKRLKRDGWIHEPLVRVVELRRKAAQSRPTEDPSTVAWTHQWVVSGHWHSYWTGPEDKKILQPRWLMPYVKGPEDKPLKAPRAKVFAVVR